MRFLGATDPALCYSFHYCWLTLGVQHEWLQQGAWSRLGHVIWLKRANLGQLNTIHETKPATANLVVNTTSGSDQMTLAVVKVKKIVLKIQNWPCRCFRAIYLLHNTVPQKRENNAFFINFVRHNFQQLRQKYNQAFVITTKGINTSYKLVFKWLLQYAMGPSKENF